MRHYHHAQGAQARGWSWFTRESSARNFLMRMSCLQAVIIIATTKFTCTGRMYAGAGWVKSSMYIYANKKITL